jgi:hypothetical protein
VGEEGGKKEWGQKMGRNKLSKMVFYQLIGTKLDRALFPLPPFL